MTDPHLKPGDIVGGRFEVIGGPVAIQGKEGCTDPRCSRIGDRCAGYHCPHCGEPCSMVGHKKCREAE